MNLLVDIGNTRLKWATSNGLSLVPGFATENIDINRDTLTQLWHSLTPPEQLAISCVGAGRLIDLVTDVAKERWPGIRLIRAKSVATAWGVSNAYSEPEKLGVDRWLGIIAAYNQYKKALCVVSCGTAITLDVVDAKGQHLGGMISPGLRLMKAALADNTENLGLDENAYPFELAANTAAAIYNGTISAVCGLIEHALNVQPDNLQLILTGGDAELIATQLPKLVSIDPDLVLRGLALTLTK